MSELGETVSPPSTIEEPEEVENLVADGPQRMINFST